MLLLWSDFRWNDHVLYFPFTARVHYRCVLGCLVICFIWIANTFGKVEGIEYNISWCNKTMNYNLISYYIYFRYRLCRIILLIRHTVFVFYVNTKQRSYYCDCCAVHALLLCCAGWVWLWLLWCDVHVCAAHCCVLLVVLCVYRDIKSLFHHHWMCLC